MTDNELVNKMAKRVSELMPAFNHEFNIMIARTCRVIVMEFLDSERAANVVPFKAPASALPRDPIFVIDVLHHGAQVSQAVALNRESARSCLHGIMQTNPSIVMVSVADLGTPTYLVSDTDVDRYLPDAKDMS